MTASPAWDLHVQSSRAHFSSLFFETVRHYSLPAHVGQDAYNPSLDYMRFCNVRQRVVAGAPGVSSGIFYRMAITRPPACVQASADNLAVVAMAVGYHTVGGYLSMMVKTRLTKIGKTQTEH